MEDEQKYPIGELIAQSKEIFGVMPEVVVGALHGGTKAEHTVAEVQVMIDEFLIRKVN